MKRKIYLLAAAAVILTSSYLRAVSITFTSDDVIEDGDIYDNVFVYDTPPDQTTVDMLGGSILDVSTFNSSTFNIYAGEIAAGMVLHDSSRINIYSGNVAGMIIVEDSGWINIYGGDVSLGAPSFSEASTVNIYGYGFNYDGSELTGFLSDGSPFTMWEVSLSDYEHMNFVPEPCSLILLALGTLMLRARRNN